MKLLAAIIFFAAFAAWAWLEFISPATTGLKDILFWIGMGAALFVGSCEDRARSRG